MGHALPITKPASAFKRISPRLNQRFLKGFVQRFPWALCRLSRLGQKHRTNRGRDKGRNLAPPSKPDGRVSRIRLSSQWVRSFTMVRVHWRSAAKDSSPPRANHSWGQRRCASPDPCRVRPRRFSSRLLHRRLTQPSTLANPFAWLCWKYPYQPRNARFTPFTMAAKLRAVCSRTRSLNFFRLFARGHFRPRSK